MDAEGEWEKGMRPCRRWCFEMGPCARGGETELLLKWRKMRYDLWKEAGILFGVESTRGNETISYKRCQFHEAWTRWTAFEQT